ncbi:MAG: flagellar basal body P-ring formation protein FlgA [Deltaproteobacteria bacterium]|nr:flagellar basal body P-ring formation protein FlgA [Deltaproteobacteria bacterium]
MSRTMKAFNWWLLVAGLLSTTVARADRSGREVAFQIAPQVVVRGESITLRDIAVFKPCDSEYAPLVEALQDITLANAPAPRTKTVLLGATVLETIQRSGLPIQSVGYAIPKAISIEREGRIVAKDEVLSALKNVLWDDKTLDVQVRDIEWANEQVIPTGVTQVRTERLGQPSSGKIPVRVEVFVDEKAAARFLATASVDDWREVPVPNRILERGALVSPDDVQMVRLNLLQQPADIVSRLEEIVGRRAKSRISAGETVRKTLLDIPPVIPKGKRVTVVFKRGSLSASMVGSAVEDGFDNGTIRVKNESSKKIVLGRVKNEDIVEVE